MKNNGKLWNDQPTLWLWLLTRGYNKRALTGKILVLWIDGHLWQVVDYERWSHMKVLMYHKMNFNSPHLPRKQGMG